MYDYLAWLLLGLFFMVCIVWYLNKVNDTYTSLWGWEPCDSDSLFEMIASLIIGNLQCQCCMLWRGIFIGIFVATWVLLPFIFN